MLFVELKISWLTYIIADELEISETPMMCTILTAQNSVDLLMNLTKRGIVVLMDSPILG
jgi:hypothetical protein